MRPSINLPDLDCAMLAEHFVAAISTSTKPNTAVSKDLGVFLHEFQPLCTQRHVFKKSTTAPNGLAVSSSHVFAAQADKAIVHVYSRERGNQEALVPFPERIHSIALAAQDAVLLLGTESGRVLAWEISSGRVVSTTNAHLQPVTCLVVDPTSNFFLSGSADAMIHVWSLPSVLSFSPDASNSPIRTLSTHRGPISSLICGHSWSCANIAVSVSGDKSAIVWDYHNGQVLRTYLLPQTPTAVVLDPADRAFYIAYADGSLQMIDFYDEAQRMTSIDVLRDPSLSHRPVQPPPKTRFDAESQKLGAALSLSLSWDGTTLISGHESGKIAAWDVAKRSYNSTVTNLAGPVSNLQFLSPTGHPNKTDPSFIIQTITKPKQEELSRNEGTGLIPPNYTLNVELKGRINGPGVSATGGPDPSPTIFDEALTHPSFPTSLLEESLGELETWGAPSSGAFASGGDFIHISQDENAIMPGLPNITEVEELKKQLASLQRIQKVTFSQLSELREEKEHFLKQERQRADRARKRAQESSGLLNGTQSMRQAQDAEMGGIDEASPEPE